MASRRRIPPRAVPDPPTVPAAVRNEYASHPGGAAGFYAEAGASYRNPHVDAVRSALALLSFDLRARYLDLCCGSGEVTDALVVRGVPFSSIAASDPFTGDAYLSRWSRSVDATWSFDDLAAGALAPDRFDVAVCSYALHLCAPSVLPAVCVQLALAVPELVVVTPHKRPHLRPEWGYGLVEEHHHQSSRARVRRYRALAQPPDVR